ncbi:MAG TPA: RDD family protein [Candidatus Limnocylindria bacterium]|nr:RDD family protein [Candidatus Limnocylindria bacterium]
MTTTTATTAASTDKAGWFTRFLAILIDGIGVSIVSGILTNILYQDGGVGASGLQTLLGVIYFCYFWSSYGKGQTLGMRALGIKVVKTDGSQLDLVGAFLRYVGLFISILCLFIGVIWAAFDAQKQGWHDKIAGTYVVKA